MKRIVTLLHASVFLILLAAISGNAAMQEDNRNFYRLNQALYDISNFYLDTVNQTELTDKAIAAMVAALDPHSTYIPADQVKEMNEPLVGNFEGIGIEFAIINDTLTVQSVIPGGPSERVGIRSGDKIVSVDGETIAGTSLTIPRVHKYLRGQKGSKVLVGVIRRGEDRMQEFLITRDKIPLNSVDAAYETEDGIHYVKLGRFSASSYREIITALFSAEKVPEGVILDLRGNGGGYLIAALQIANEFLERGNLILYTEGRNAPMMREYANGRGRLQNVPVAVLIDENSASASEIVSGALQDWDRGVIIGRRSFGKGLVQRQFDLLDGSQLRLTVARYHTPSGRVIQSPYKEGEALEYYKAFYDRFASGEYMDKDSISFPDSLKYSTLRLKRTVYGGGGIMPDIFVPADTSYYSPFYRDVLRKGVLVDFVNGYTDRMRETIMESYADSLSFMEQFEVDEALWGEFVAYAASRECKYLQERDSVSADKLSEFIKGLIIRNMYGMNSYFIYMNRSDEEVLRALEILRSHQVYGLSGQDALSDAES